MFVAPALSTWRSLALFYIFTSICIIIHDLLETLHGVVSLLYETQSRTCVYRERSTSKNAFIAAFSYRLTEAEGKVGSDGE